MFSSLVIGSEPGLDAASFGAQPSSEDKARWRSVLRDREPGWAQSTSWPGDCGLLQTAGPAVWPSLVEIESNKSPLVDAAFRAALTDAGLVDGWQTIAISAANLDGEIQTTHELLRVRDHVATIELAAATDASRPTPPVEPSALDELISNELRKELDPPPLSFGAGRRILASPAAVVALSAANLSGLQLTPLLWQDEVDAQWWFTPSAIA